METDIGQKDASIKVTSDHPVIPERAMLERVNDFETPAFGI